MKRFFALILSLSILGGCSWPKENQTTELPEPEAAVQETTVRDESVPPYFKVEFMVEENYLQAASVVSRWEDRLLCAGSENRSNEPRELFWTDFKGETREDIPLELADGETVQGMTIDREGEIYLILAKKTEIERVGDGIPWNYQDIHLVMLDGARNLTGDFPIDCQDGSVSSLAVSTGGEIYVIRCEYDDEQGVFSNHYLDQYDQDGELVASISANMLFPNEKRATLGGFLSTPEGDILLRVQINEYDKLYSLSMKPEDYTEPVFEFEEGMNWPEFYTGPGADYYVQDENLGFLAYSLTKEPKLLFRLQDLEPTVPNGAWFVAEIGEYEYLFATWLESQNYYFTVTGQWEPLPETEKTVLTVGSFTEYAGGSILRKATLFNILHPGVELQVKMYSVDENTPGGYVEAADANDALQRDILNGEGPDILILDQYGFASGVYTGNGYLADLAPLMAGDEAFEKKNYFYNLWETDSGTVSYMPLSFELATMATGKEITGEGGWTPSEALALAKETGTPFVCYADSVKEYVLGDGFVNYIEGNTCNFVDGEFAAMLELLKLEDQDLQMEDFRLRKRLVLGEKMYIWNASDLLFAKAHYGDYSLMGVPNPQRETINIIIPYGVGIAEHCVDKEVAWEFVKMMMDTSGNWSLGFGITRNSVMEAFEEAMLPAEDPNSALAHTGYSVGEEELVGQPLSRAQVEYLLEQIEQAKPQMVDVDLKTIVQEECDAFFAGDKTAEEVAELVQSRVRIYLSERS